MFLLCNTFLTALTFAVLCLASASAAQADTIIFQPDRATFNAATASQTTITFEHIAPANDYSDYTNSLTVGGVTFSNGVNGNIFSGVHVSDSGYDRGAYSLNSGATLASFVGSDGAYATTATLPTGGATAIGMDLGFSYPENISVTLSNEQRRIVTLNGIVYNDSTNQFVPSPVFLGFTSDVAITSLSFTTLNNIHYLRLDNFSFGTAITTTQQQPTATPEPATMLLLGTGLAGVAAKIRRRRQAKAV